MGLEVHFARAFRGGPADFRKSIARTIFSCTFFFTFTNPSSFFRLFYGIDFFLF
jgi:hypothetical protein